MNTMSVSELKTNPAKAIDWAQEIPVALQKRNKIKAYIIGKDLFEKIVEYIEDYLDQEAVKKTNFAKGRNFDHVARELGI